MRRVRGVEERKRENRNTWRRNPALRRLVRRYALALMRPQMRLPTMRFLLHAPPHQRHHQPDAPQKLTEQSYHLLHTPNSHFGLIIFYKININRFMKLIE